MDIQLDKFVPRKYQEAVCKAFEEQGKKKVLLVWPRRCLSGDTHILLASGSFKLLKDVVVGDEILSWDGQTFVPDVVVNAWKTEEKEVFRLKAFGQLPIDCSSDHKFATITNKDNIHWRTAGEIKPRDKVLRYGGSQCGAVHNPELSEFIGYLMSDGYVSGYQQPKFTNTNMTILSRVEELAFKLYGYKAIWRTKGNGYDLGLSNGTLGGGTFKNAIKELFRADGSDVGKRNRRLPSCVWSFDEESILRLLASVISCDGSFYVSSREFISDRGRLVPPPAEVSIHCGYSYYYAWDIYWLLRKIGIRSHVPILEKDANWKLRIGNQLGIKKLLTYRVYGKEEAQENILAHVSNYTFKKRSIFGCYPTPAKVESLGRLEPLYDLETKNNHNFVANGYVVHNSGKDLVAWTLMYREAIRRVGNYIYCLPTYQQCKLVIWQSITNSNGIKFPDLIPEELVAKKNESELTIHLVNGSIIRLVGSDNYDRSIVGQNAVMFAFSEFALADQEAYYLAARPILAQNDGKVIFVSTPRAKNHFYDLYQIAAKHPDWFCQRLTVKDTKHVSIEELERDIEAGLMSRDLCDQEFYCSFDKGQAGTVFGKYIDAARLSGRITSVPWDPRFKVHTAFDLGVRDATAIIFFQVVGTAVHLIDYYEQTGKGLEFYVNYLKSKPYTYGKHTAPHDIRVRELGSGMSRIETARQLGLSFEIAPNLLLEDGIEAVRATMPRMLIDERSCKVLVKALENYHYEFDSKRNVYSATPLHDNSSHAADCIRYLCISLPRMRDGLSPEDIEKNYRDAVYGNEGQIPAPFRQPNNY